jgi:hypothetical protein
MYLIEAELFGNYNELLSCNILFSSNPTTPMGLLNRLRGKKDDIMEKVKEQTTPQPTHPTNAPPPPGRRIKRYTSEVKPIYE